MLVALQCLLLRIGVIGRGYAVARRAAPGFLPLLVATASTGLTGAQQVPDSLRLEFLLTDKVCGMNRRKFMKQVLGRRGGRVGCAAS
jgi:hypothetical protein